jgi:hypothetical protein
LTIALYMVGDQYSSVRDSETFLERFRKHNIFLPMQICGGDLCGRVWRSVYVEEKIQKVLDFPKPQTAGKWNS